MHGWHVCRQPGPGSGRPAGDSPGFHNSVHITLGRALDPLLYNLPRTLQADEMLRRNPPDDEGSPAARERSEDDTKVLQKGNFLTRFLKPWIFADYWTLRDLVPREENLDVPDQRAEVVESSPYLPPSVTSPAPFLWIPEDPGDLSKREIAETRKVIPITDEGCTLDEKNRLVWDTIGARPPTWTGKVYY